MGPLTSISGFIPSYAHLQPWLNRVSWGYNNLITYNYLGGPLLVRPYFCGVIGSPGVVGSLDTVGPLDFLFVLW